MSMTFAGPAAVRLYRLHVLAAAVKSEARAQGTGITMFRRSMRAQAARECGLSPRAPHAAVLAALEERIEAARQTMTVTTDDHGHTTVTKETDTR